MTMVVKTSNDPRALITAVQREVTSMDKELPVYNVKTMDEYLAASVAAPRFNTTLLAIFAAVALVLTIVEPCCDHAHHWSAQPERHEIRISLRPRADHVMSDLPYKLNNGKHQRHRREDRE